VRNKITAGFIVLLGALSILVVTELPAAASFSDCTFGHGCVYTDANGGGSKMDLPFSTYGTGACWDFPATFRNTISSSIETYQNGWHFKFYAGFDCSDQTGATAWTQPDDTSANWGGVHNDNIESFKIIR
jgi:hypothetical protein